MILPIRTTIDDVKAVCTYLITKPMGVEVSEAKKVLSSKCMDSRKLTAYRAWGVIIDDGGKLKLSELGRSFAKGDEKGRKLVLRKVIKNIKPYIAAVERAAHLGEEVMTTDDLAAYWHEHFNGEVADSEKILKDQAVCFFQIVDAAGLGKLLMSRRGSLTRIDFIITEVRDFVGGSMQSNHIAESLKSEAEQENNFPLEDEETTEEFVTENNFPEPGKVSRVFITHGKDKEILEQVKDIVEFGNFEPIVASEREAISKPVPEKVLDDIRSCQAGIIHVANEKPMVDDSGIPHSRLNENVLIEIGAAMALYKRNFILLVKEGVKLPSNLQGLYECRYDGEKLDGDSTMKLLKAFNGFRN